MTRTETEKSSSDDAVELCFVSHRDQIYVHTRKDNRISLF